MSDAKGKPSAVIAREFKGTLAFAEITVNIRGKSQYRPSASTQPTDGSCKPEAWASFHRSSAGPPFLNILFLGCARICG